MKRISFFKVYGVEDPKLAERRMRGVGVLDLRNSLGTSIGYEALTVAVFSAQQSSASVETQVIDGVYQKPEKPELQPYQRAILENQPVIRWSNRRQRWPTANVVTAQFDDEVIVTCRNCGGSPRKGLMHGLCFRCSGEKAINHEI